MNMITVGTILIGGLLLVASYTDIRERRISNAVTGCLLIVALVARGVEGQYLLMLQGMMMAGVISICFFIYGMGGGDVKLLAGLGVYLGPWAWLDMFSYAAIIGLLWAIARLIWTGKFGQWFKSLPEQFRAVFGKGSQTVEIDQTPLAPFFTIGTALVLCSTWI